MEEHNWFRRFGITSLSCYFYLLLFCLDLAGDLEQEALNRINEGVFRTTGNQKLGINTATYDDCTCCVIKPHIVSAGMLGAVIYEIQKAGFDISAIQAVRKNLLFKF